MFAGPNGSGKSTLYELLRKAGTIHTEIYLSADRIEAELKSRGKFTFNAYRISSNEEEFFEFVMKSGLWKRAKLKTLVIGFP